MEYTPAQLEIVNRLLNSANYFEVLGVTYDATVRQIKSAYRELVKQVHPDKNFAPGAEEAFKMLSAAEKTLSHPSRRLVYLTQINYRPPPGGVLECRESTMPLQEDFLNWFTFSWCMIVFISFILLSLSAHHSGYIFDSNNDNFPVELQVKGIKYYVGKNYQLPTGDDLTTFENTVEQEYFTYMNEKCRREYLLFSGDNGEMNWVDMPSCASLYRVAILQAVNKY